MKKSEQGDFFIAQDECVACGTCEGVAPKFFSQVPNGYGSHVKKQPKTIDDLRKMFEASRKCMVDCIYYKGSDDLLFEHFKNIYDCYEINGNVCTAVNCPCFDGYISAQSAKSK